MNSKTLLNYCQSNYQSKNNLFGTTITIATPIFINIREVIKTRHSLKNYSKVHLAGSTGLIKMGLTVLITLMSLQTICKIKKV